MTKRLSIDRIINSIAVCYDDNDKKYELPADGLAEGQLIDADFDESGAFVSARVCVKETQDKRDELNARLNALLNRKKK